MIINFISEKKYEHEIRRDIRKKMRHEHFEAYVMSKFDENSNELEREKKAVRKEALEFKKEGFTEGFNVSMMNYKKLYFAQRHIKICRQHFKLFLQEARIIGINASFANALKKVSEHMMSISRGSAKPEEVILKSKIAMKKSKEAAHLTERMGQMIQNSFNEIGVGFTQKDDEEIDEMFRNLLASDEAEHDISDKELNQKIENHIKSLDSNI